MFLVLITGCGARSNLRGGEGGSGGSSVVSGGQTGATNPASGATTTGGGMCNLPPPPLQTQPTGPGCYSNMMNMGWVEVPCACALWLRNTNPTPVMATLDLSASPADQVPTLDGSLDMEIALADPGGTYFGIWSHQPGNGTELAVKSDGKETTVRMGAAHVTLLPIPIPACTTGIVNARIAGGSGFGPKLDMHAVLDEGMPPVETNNECSNPPPT